MKFLSKFFEGKLTSRSKKSSKLIIPPKKDEIPENVKQDMAASNKEIIAALIEKVHELKVILREEYGHPGFVFHRNRKRMKANFLDCLEDALRKEDFSNEPDLNERVRSLIPHVLITKDKSRPFDTHVITQGVFSNRVERLISDLLSGRLIASLANR